MLQIHKTYADKNQIQVCFECTKPDAGGINIISKICMTMKMCQAK